MARVRRAAGQRRVGHAGTLDPLATGVLVVAVGHATRLLEFAAGHDKSYRAVITLGATSDTDDAEGAVTPVADVSGLSADEVCAALESLAGVRAQVPPRYSAIKLGGRPAYRLAREGRAVGLAPRTVAIHRLGLLGWSPPAATVAVECGPGTYVRSLARELGERLGCGGYLSALRRLRSGAFTLERSAPLEALCAALAAGRWHDYALPPRLALGDQPHVVVDDAAAARLRQGQEIALDSLPANPAEVAALSPEGDVVAIMRPGHRLGLWRPRKVLGDA